ncbi:MAG: hypothetical protein K2K45_01670 [Muribaculaceae bacterium]|nr:hypothetical protein [Muribaculaceae bacterium]
MKKLLLLSALAVCGMTASANSFSDVFSLTCDGEPVADGQTITTKYYYDIYAELGGILPPEYEAKVDVTATNTTNSEKGLFYRLTRIQPTLEEFPSQGSEIGTFKLCYSIPATNNNNCGILRDDQIVPGDGSPLKIPASAEATLDIDQCGFTNFTPTTFQLYLETTDDAGKTLSSTIFINFKNETDITNAVAGIEAETEAEYYTIQGIRLAQPVKGQPYIERKGSNVTKHLF